MADVNVETDKQDPKKRKGCLGWLLRLGLLGLVLLAGFVVWLNGPGLRWLGPKVAKHFLEKADFLLGSGIAFQHFS